MLWTPHGPSESAFFQSHQNGRSSTVPAVAAYRGELWCFGGDSDGNAWYASTAGNSGFGDRIAFPLPGIPLIANLNGHLHAIIVLRTGEMAHCLYDDEKLAWIYLGTIAGAVTHSKPCLAAFQDRLFITFSKERTLQYATWTVSGSADSRIWSQPTVIPGATPTLENTSSLVVLAGTLRLLCAFDSKRPRLLSYSYDSVQDLWFECEDISKGRAVAGLSATSYGDKTFISFANNGPDTTTQAVFVTPITADQQQPRELVAHQGAAGPPQLCILNGVLHCIFADNTSSRNLHWFSRPLHPFSLTTWMSLLPPSIPLSRVTIPGTHDSCARSNIPYVRTQHLTIPQQLHLGIRFLDLRLRLHSNSTLYLYHGGVPLNFPRLLPFTTVLSSIFNFLATFPSETVLVSIANDDPTPGDPAPFYQAVFSVISASPSQWYTLSTTPLISTVRGRAILLRRYPPDPLVPLPLQQGLDLSLWINNSPSFTITTSTNVRLHIQDKWRYAERIALSELIESKSTYVKQHMAKAAGAWTPVTSPVEETPSSDEEDGEDDWYINFCSAVGDPTEHGEVAEAKWIAVGAREQWRKWKWIDGMNRITREFLVEAEFGTPSSSDENDKDSGSQRKAGVRLGIVNLDYPELPLDSDLVAKLIALNF